LDVYETMKVRLSTRKYQTKPIEEEKVSRVLEAGRLSPSAANRQPWHFLVITDPQVRARMKEAYDRRWFVEAPVILVVCADPGVAWVRSDGEPYWKVDAAIAMQNMVLQATAEGLGTCWIGAFDEAAAKRILNIPRDIRVVAMTPLGYPDKIKEKVTNRKDIHDILHTNKW